VTSFQDKLSQRARATGGILCVGLDPDPEQMPKSMTGSPDSLYGFCSPIVAATKRYAVAYKANLAFFEAHGSRGIAQLERLLAEIPSDIPTILDGKRGDIGNTARLYARFLFEHLNGDAATVSPYLGRDSLDPFFAYEGRIPFVLCVTSNLGAQDVQLAPSGDRRIYHRIIDLLERMGKPYGLVTGATHVALLEEIRRLAPNAPLLIPGIGAQGGDLSATLAAVAGGAALVNVSRDILYASTGEDFAEAAGRRAQWYVEQMKPHCHTSL